MNRRSFIARFVGAIAAASIIFNSRATEETEPLPEVPAPVPATTQVAYFDLSAYFNKVLADDIHRYPEFFEEVKALDMKQWGHIYKVL